MYQNILLHLQICTSHSNEQSVAHTKGISTLIRDLSSVYTYVVKVICDDEIVRFFFYYEVIRVLTMLKFQFNFFNYLQWIKIQYNVLMCIILVIRWIIHFFTILCT